MTLRRAADEYLRSGTIHERPNSRRQPTDENRADRAHDEPPASERPPRRMSRRSPIPPAATMRRRTECPAYLYVIAVSTALHAVAAESASVNDNDRVRTGRASIRAGVRRAQPTSPVQRTRRAACAARHRPSSSITSCRTVEQMALSTRSSDGVKATGSRHADDAICARTSRARADSGIRDDDPPGAQEKVDRKEVSTRLYVA